MIDLKLEIIIRFTREEFEERLLAIQRSKTIVANRWDIYGNCYYAAVFYKDRSN